MLLRPGNAGANNAADHIRVVTDALAQLPLPGNDSRPGRRVLVRTDGAGGTHEFVNWLTRRRVQYSVGFGLTEAIARIVDDLPDRAWTPAYNADGLVRDGAWVAELTAMVNLRSWPPDLRLIVRAERPHPGAQLRFTDSNGHRLTAFATNTRGGQLAALELRHRRRARCEDRIRAAKSTGLSKLPLHGFQQNQIWIAIVMLACELTAWLQMLALTTSDARRWEPKRLRYRLLWIAGRLARRNRRTHLRLASTAPYVRLAVTAYQHLATLDPD
jgi:hypothetical protein